MSRKTKNSKYEYRCSEELDVSVVNDAVAVYQAQADVELFDEKGNRRYYTVDEYAENLRVAINQRYGYELIAKR